MGWLHAAMAGEGLSMADLEQHIHAAAVARTGGNLSATARLLGLSRVQVAYRIEEKKPGR